MPATVLDLIRSSASRYPQRAAIVAAGRPLCAYDHLARHIEATVATLARWGLEPGNRLAVVLPNGPEMVTTFLAASTAATCAPLNPAYREQEFEFYFNDLKTAALITIEGDHSAARTVARRLGISVLECRVPQHAPAGCFELVPGDAVWSDTPRTDAAPLAAPSDIALVLHTSGTTARPKQVPLSHANLCASARNIASTLCLGPDDRCLNVLPLFHIHGLVAAVLGTLVSGGSLVSTSGFLATQFFDWLSEFDPTWFTAVPPMHQALLARARQLNLKPPVGRLRFVRTSSSPLPVTAIAELEALFGSPVIDAYGMTEAAHQMASNPLPPAARKPGSVGRPAGSEVAIMDERGQLLEPGATGEVVVRGENVTSGYDGNAEANQAAFAGGWFHTGDQGWLDRDGYLFLTGRLKELINRGGEKIAPAEIDAVFSEHPAVAQAAAFGVPDPRLGEEIGLAVVLREGQQVLSRELLAFASRRLADFKLPRHVFFVDGLPKGATGKLQRVGLAERLGVDLDARVDVSRPEGRTASTPSEHVVAETFAEVLRLERVSVAESFFRLGGDSLLAVTLSCRLEEKTGVEVPTYILLEHDTAAALAAYIDERSHGRAERVPAPAVDTSVADAPLTSQQEFHWMIETVFRGSPINHRPGAIHITGPLDVAALQAAIDGVLSRHAPLRSTIVLQGLRPRLVAAATTSCPVPFEDLSALSPDVRQATLEKTGRRFAHHRFDLLKGPLFKTMLVRLSEDDHVLLFSIHHIVFDGWSMSVFISDIAALYEAHVQGGSAALPELPTSYAEHAARQRAALDAGELDASIQYWRTHLNGLLPPFSPFSHGEPHARPTGFGQEFRVTIDPVLATRVAAASQRRAATPFIAYMAVFGAFCRVLDAPDDLVFGAFVSGRSTPSVTRLIGCLYNLLPIRIDLSGDPAFPELVDQAHRTATASLIHQNVPYGHLLRRLRPPGGRFFDVAFQCRNFPASKAQGGAVSFEDVPFDWGLSQWDLLVEITPRDAGPEVRFAYARDLCQSDDFGQRCADAFARALEWAAEGSRPLSALVTGNLVGSGYRALHSAPAAGSPATEAAQ